VAAGGRVLGLVLAAGRAARMGRPKQLAELDGRPLLEHALAAMSAAPVDDVAVAVGAYAGDVLATVDLHRARPLLVDGWAAGMGHVLAESVAAAGAGYGAVVVALGDQPLVTGEVVASVVEAWRRGSGPVVTATYRGRPGHPKLFDRSLLPELRGLAGDAGARDLLAGHPEWVVGVEVAGLGSDLDVDDETRLARAAELLARRDVAARPRTATGTGGMP
jgi:CTP:molybdopterin cytidylyltransferase MocA